MLAGFISCREVWLDANVHVSFCLFGGRCPHHRLLSHLVIPPTQISALRWQAISKAVENSL